MSIHQQFVLLLLFIYFYIVLLKAQRGKNIKTTKKSLFNVEKLLKKTYTSLLFSSYFFTKYCCLVFCKFIDDSLYLFSRHRSI